MSNRPDGSLWWEGTLPTRGRTPGKTPYTVLVFHSRSFPLRLKTASKVVPWVTEVHANVVSRDAHSPLVNAILTEEECDGGLG